MKERSGHQDGCRGPKSRNGHVLLRRVGFWISELGSRRPVKGSECKVSPLYNDCAVLSALSAKNLNGFV
jgi:hypothetical protein